MSRSRRGAATLVACVLASAAAHAQDEAPAPGPLTLGPAPFTIRRTGTVEFDLGFKLSEEGTAQLELRFAEPKADEARPGTPKEAPGSAEVCVLGLEFEPFEGVHFTWTRSAAGAPPVRARLTDVREPKGLEYRLHCLLPPDGGIVVTMEEGDLLLAATTPHARTMVVTCDASGGVIGLLATEPRRSTTLPEAAWDAAAWRELVRVSPLPQDPVTLGHPDALLGLTSAPPPPLHAVRPVDTLPAPEGTIERTLLETVEMVEVPTLVVTPSDGKRHPALLLLAGGSEGKASATALAAVVAYARATTGVAREREPWVVAVADVLGCGERAEVTPYDSLHSFELLLVGSSPAAAALTEARQLVAWLAARDDVDPQQVRVSGLAEGAWFSAKLALAEYGPVPCLAPPTASDAASPELLEASRFGPELVRSRYDSWLLDEARRLREEVPAPDTTRSLAQRIEQALQTASRRDSGRKDAAAAVAFGTQVGPAAWRPGDPLPVSTRHVTLAASDFGPRTALEEALRRLPAREGELYLALGDLCTADPALGARVGRLSQLLETLRTGGAGAPAVRLFGEGSSGVVMLLAATLASGTIESVTALHALASFELLLQRPQDALRAPDGLGVLSQGQPAELYVPGVLGRFELEECVLALRARGVPVDWQEPVDALRRPLSRHDRLAMWPRVRHQDFIRPK